MLQAITVDTVLSLITLIGMEIVLGIDNIIFLSIIVSKLPRHQQDKTRRLGLGLALLTRLGLLLSLTTLMKLTEPLFSVFNQAISGRDLILLCGGLFLVAKATFEIHDKLESGTEEETFSKVPKNRGLILLQIALLDVIFSLDSVITAVGMAKETWVMVSAIIVAVVVMLFAAKAIGTFVDKHPTVKLLALSFLILIGVTLVIEGMGGHVSKGYIYFAMFFSFGVEMLNIKYLKKQSTVKIHFPRPPLKK